MEFIHHDGNFKHFHRYRHSHAQQANLPESTANRTLNWQRVAFIPPFPGNNALYLSIQRQLRWTRCLQIALQELGICDAGKNRALPGHGDFLSTSQGPAPKGRSRRFPSCAVACPDDAGRRAV
jgi:hypothetical protein